MNAGEFKSFSVYIDNENVTISEYLGKDVNGEVKRNLIFKSPLSPHIPNMIAAIFDNILRQK